MAVRGGRYGKAILGEVQVPGGQGIAERGQISGLSGQGIRDPSQYSKELEEAFLEKGPDLFAEDSVVAQYERRLAELEQLVGKKKVERALSKIF